MTGESVLTCGAAAAAQPSYSGASGGPRAHGPPAGPADVSDDDDDDDKAERPRRLDGRTSPPADALPDHSPELVQAEDWRRPGSFSAAATPLFLIHDGGGTTFAYHCLDPLHRFVYGLANPYFSCGSRFAGGLAEMGRLYAERIRAAVAAPDFPARRNADGSVDVLLGGWSLGGMLSLEVAHLLVRDCLVRVVGILMVDTVYPRRPAGFSGLVDPPDMSEDGKTKNQILSQRCMVEARRMVPDWDIPVWEGADVARRPKMVLLRATECVPPRGPGINGLDIDRDDRAIGWSRHDAAMFDDVLDVQGHHFNLFDFDRVSATTAAIRKGLRRLEAAIYPSGLRASVKKAHDKQ